jgi:hypothetical protein
MSVLTQAIYNRLAGDGTLTAMLNTYDGAPAIFTTDPAPGNATMPYIVTAGEVAQEPFDTKQSRGRTATRDVRCYTAAGGSAATVEAIAERVRTLLHRQLLTIADHEWLLTECSGPQVADEQDAYGRIVTARITIQEV